MKSRVLERGGTETLQSLKLLGDKTTSRRAGLRFLKSSAFLSTRIDADPSVAYRWRAYSGRQNRHKVAESWEFSRLLRSPVGEGMLVRKRRRVRSNFRANRHSRSFSEPQAVFSEEDLRLIFGIFLHEAGVEARNAVSQFSCLGNPWVSTFTIHSLRRPL